MNNLHEKCHTSGDFELVEKTVLDMVTPTNIQIRLLHKFFQLISKTLYECMAQHSLLGVVELEGSLAKGTLLRDKWEIDVFVLLDNVDKNWIDNHAENFLVSCLGRKFPYILKYSQHPYITLLYNGMEADVVPVIRVKRPGISGLGVERTPFHTRFIKENLTDYQKDQVRILKSFLKGIDVYGAETHVGGFSGYVAELLIFHYGSFNNLIESAGRWKPPILIDPTGQADIEYLKRKYPESPIILVDPVDTGRNAAASVTRQSLARFILASKLYKYKPNLSFFHVCRDLLSKEATPQYLPGLYSLTVTCSGDLTRYSPEVIWSKLMRAARESKEQLIRMTGIKVFYTSIETDETSSFTIYFLADRCEPLPYELVKGPPITGETSNIVRFISKRKEAIMLLNDDRLWGIRIRKIYSVDHVIVSVIKKIVSVNSCQVDCHPCRKVRTSVCDPTPVWMRYTLRIQEF